MLEIKEKLHKKTRKQRKKNNEKLLTLQEKVFDILDLLVYLYISICIFWNIYVCRAMEKFKHVFSCAICLLYLNLDFYHLSFVFFHFHKFVFYSTAPIFNDYERPDHISTVLHILSIFLKSVLQFKVLYFTVTFLMNGVNASL